MTIREDNQLIASHASIEATEVARSVADSLSSLSAFISRIPAAAFRKERPRFRAVWTWLLGLLRSVAVLPGQPPLMIIFGLASTKELWAARLGSGELA